MEGIEMLLDVRFECLAECLVDKVDVLDEFLVSKDGSQQGSYASGCIIREGSIIR